MRALWLLFLVGCSGGDDTIKTDDTAGGGDDSGGSTDNDFAVRIKSPEDGATFDFGESVDFVAKATKNGEATDIKTATWTIGPVVEKGDDISIDDLPSGTWDVELSAVVGKQTLTESVSITIKDAPPMNYEGRANIDLHLDHPDYGEYDDGCDGGLTFVATGSAFSGSGTCKEELFGETFPFTLEGTVAGGNIEGSLILDADGTQYSTPFTGSGKYGDSFNANFDYTHSADGATLRVYGTWNADPQ